jgi:DNA invertase Pin-like site-specific DNA recombinase
MRINQKYGYPRVSSRSQQDNSSIERQKQELIRNEIPKENIRVEVESAADCIQNRPKFQHLIQHELQENDLVMITKLDRSSRSTLEFLKLQDAFFKRNITFVALDLPNSLDLATNRLIATTLSGIAESEKNRRKERQKQGIRAAKQAGKYKGWKSVIK